MAMVLSARDVAILVAVLIAGTTYLLRSRNASATKTAAIALSSSGSSSPKSMASTGRDFVAAMKQAKKKIIIFYGSQTGTAEDYATKIAKEAKARYGLSSLVCDPEEYDFDNLDQVPSDSLVVFCVATYGEGEPTDNAVVLMDFLKEDEPAFSNGTTLENLNYVVFSLGNSTYEQYCEVGRSIDARLTKLGATRVGERGEGDDDKSMEEDYLAWKDGMWEAVQAKMDWQEGEGGDSADFEISEVDPALQDESKVFLGELSMRALTGTRGVYDAKNPYISPLVSSRELFDDGDRNCVFAEFDITDSGLRYQTGDHVGVWPLNPEGEVERLLRVLGLYDRKDQIINVKSLDPALAKVPFPVPTTYDVVFRHYLDICSVASRQNVGSFAKFASNDSARLEMERLGSDKAYYHSIVADRSMKLADVLAFADGGNSTATWAIPFDRIISGIPRLQPRYYSISSSPKLYPNSIHVTAVVLKYKPHAESPGHSYGVGTNYLLNLKTAQGGGRSAREEDSPAYQLDGPRGKYLRPDGGVAAPIHVRRSNFRLPTSPKIPVIMIGPGTGVAPFRAFVQDRVVLARKAKAKDPDALKDWGTIDLFYGCRRSDWDYLYKAEWEEYAKELDGKFRIHCALSREPGMQKVYVQELIRDQADFLTDAIVNKKGYVYICGDAKHMAREVEHELEAMLSRDKGGDQVAGAKELKVLKDRNRLLLDVW